MSNQPPNPETQATIDPDRKAWIDSASYEQLLQKWRHDPIGSPWFQPPTSTYFEKVMGEKRKALARGQSVTISKRVGW